MSEKAEQREERLAEQRREQYEWLGDRLAEIRAKQDDEIRADLARISDRLKAMERRIDRVLRALPKEPK